MSLQTAVFRDGEWVTETVGLHTVLKSLEPKPSKKAKSIKAPTCGLLTRTVVETELVHHILPVRLRSLHQNDVAFVGDHYVQVRELQPDGQLTNVLRKNDFGSRIRNAAVIGSLPDSTFEGEKNDNATSSGIKPEDSEMMDTIPDILGLNTPPRTAALPPQMLVLALESGDTVFLWISPKQDGTPQFRYSNFATPTSQLVPPGFHLAVDPSSRYMALACADRSFIVYHLDSLKSLDEQDRLGELLTPVIAYRLRTVQGVIQQMQFLFPTPGHDSHIILLLIIARNATSSMVIYEWELGDNLKDVFADEKKGYKMGPRDRVPLLLIPLTVKSAFITISEEHITVHSGVLHGSPQQFTIDIDDETPPTTCFHGQNRPLWTAWTRPFRLSGWWNNNDYLYLAREDGVVYLLETEADLEATCTLYMEQFDCSISTAFSCLYDQDLDVLVMGGDSSPGEIWKAAARERFMQLGTLPNWSPVLDFTTTDEFLTWDQEVGATRPSLNPWREKTASTPDRLFSTSGRGKKGAVTEFRYGLQARIGLEYEFDFAAKQAFVIPASHASQTAGYHLLLSMPDHTTVLHLSEDLNDASEPSDTDLMKYDVSSRTLSVSVTDEMIIQVTERNVVLIGTTQSFRCKAATLGGREDTTIFHAAICRDYIAVSTYTGLQCRLYLLEVRVGADLDLKVVKSYDIAGEVTCLSLCSLAGETLVLQAGLWQQDRLAIARAKMSGATNGMPDNLEVINPYDFASESSLEAPPATTEPIDSIASCFYNGEQYTVVGLRNGEILTFAVTKDDVVKSAPHGERLGTTAAKVTMVSEPDGTPMILASSDAQLTLITNFDTDPTEGTSLGTRKHRVWPMDVKKPAAVSPPVDWVTVLPRKLLPDRDRTVLLLLLSGKSILLAEMELQPGQAHRHIPVNGTPTKILYSHHLKCLIIAVTRGSMPTLVFLDPDTGEDLGAAEDKDGNPCNFARGLGKPGDKIYSMAEWDYKRGGYTWHFLLLGMHQGRMIVISTEREKNAPPGMQPRIRYLARFQKKGLDGSVYSVLGHGEFIIYCAGSVVRWDIIDPAEKKFRQVDSFDVGSPVTVLSVVNGRLTVLTVDQSVMILEQPSLSDGSAATDSDKHTQLVHSDSKRRRTLHMMQVAGDLTGNEGLTLVSDWNCSVSGLWTPWQLPGKDCELVFEADLGASIRRFVRGRTRPIWEQGVRKPQYGRIAMTVDDAEVLGVCMDGSLLQFQLLNVEVWRLFRFILNLARFDKDMTPFQHPSTQDLEGSNPEPVARADQMHIDGDLLQRVVQMKALERLVAKPEHLARFRELLDDMDDGRLTDELADTSMEGGDDGGYFGLAYRVMKHFMVPAL